MTTTKARDKGGPLPAERGRIKQEREEYFKTCFDSKNGNAKITAHMQLNLESISRIHMHMAGFLSSN